MRLLEMNHIKKSFDGQEVLKDISIHVDEGEVLSIIGPSGSGKSTMLRCATMLETIDDGEIIYLGDAAAVSRDGRAVYAKAADLKKIHNYYGLVFQNFNLFPHYSVLKNIVEPQCILLKRSKKEATENAMKLLKKVGLDLDPRIAVSKLKVAQQQMVEIAKAVSVNAKVIVFDEPTSSLTEQEVEHLFDIIEMLKKRGCGIIYISHKMAEIKRISDEITIMRDGTWVATEKADDLEMDDIIRLMVGRELTNQFPPKTNKPGDVALEVEHLSGMYSILNDVSFKARKGEILGIAGLDGSGRTETLETIFGIATRKSGTIKLDGKQVSNKNAQDSIKNGFALLTEERRATGIFGILNIRENTVISSLKRHKKGFYLSEKSMKEDTQKYIDALRTKTPSQETKIRALSGGNQQKVILGRWLLTDPEVLLLDEPTRGIDVGAKYEIYQLIIDLANRGKVVIVVSSEMPELLGICDRIMVMSGGRLAGEIDAEEATQELIMTYAAKYV